MIPLFLLCAIPRHLPILSNELFPVILSVILGVTNGIVGSVPMVQAPSKVSEEYRELAGNYSYLKFHMDYKKFLDQSFFSLRNIISLHSLTTIDKKNDL